VNYFHPKVLLESILILFDGFNLRTSQASVQEKSTNSQYVCISGFNWACICRYEFERGGAGYGGNLTFGLDFQNNNKLFGVSCDSVLEVLGSITN